MSSANLVALLAQLGLKITLLLGVASVVDVVVRRRSSAGLRHLLWTSAVVGSLLMPLFTAVLPALRVHVANDTSAPAVLVSPSTVRSSIPSQMATSPSVAFSESAPVGRAVSSSGVRLPSLPAAIVIAYVIGLAISLIRLFAEQLVARRLVRRSTGHDDSWMSTLSAEDRATVRERDVALMYTELPTLPLTLGIVRPVVILPREAGTWPIERRRLILAHELAHVRRRDCLTQTLAAVACALYWPHPLVWLAAARLRVERELACDDIVMGRGVDAHEYAQELLEIARSMRPSRPAPALAASMAASELESRIRAAIDTSRSRRTAGASGLFAAAFATLGFVAPIAVVVADASAAPVAPAPLEATFDTAASAPPSTSAAEAPSPSSQRPSASPIAQQPTRGLRGGTFNVRVTTKPEGQYAAGMVHVSLFTPGLNTFYLAGDKVDGLSLDQLRAPSGDLQFRIRRDAGTLQFTGTMRGDYGTGRFDFIPDAGYAAALAARGVGRLTEQQQFSIGLHDVPLAFMDELAAQRYPTPRAEELVRAGMSGVDLEFLREMGALGYQAPSLSALISLSNVGVDPTFIKQVAASGRKPSLAELRQLRMRGDVAASQVSPPRASAPTSDTPVTGRWSITSRPDGWLKLDIEWADVNQWSRLILPADLSGLSVDELTGRAGSRIAFRYDQDAGRFDFEGSFQSGAGSGQFTFAPNRAFGATLRGLGVTDVEALSTHDLKNLGFSGVSAAAVREFNSLGLGPLTKEQLLEIAVRQVTPAYVRSLQAAGIQGTDSVPVIVELRFHNFPASYATELSGLGYNTLPVHTLMAMYRGGVTPQFIQRLRAAGERDLTPDRLIELRRAARR